ncbi:uncharacterized protein UHOD_12337 [Ustilago sp. UG-2017b]|nr:uncharacterized protein UHOD_12337 [Ustilago sp. UG-2017b]
MTLAALGEYQPNRPAPGATPTGPCSEHPLAPFPPPSSDSQRPFTVASPLPRRPITVVSQHLQRPITVPSPTAQGPITALRPITATQPATRATGSSGLPITAPKPITASRLITATPPGLSLLPPRSSISQRPTHVFASSCMPAAESQHPDLTPPSPPQSLMTLTSRPAGDQCKRSALAMMDRSALLHRPQTTFQQALHNPPPLPSSPPRLPSVNAGIQPAFMTLQYESLQPLVEFIRTSPGCWLWKGDLQDAFRHIVTCLHNARLLGFSFDGVSYRENVLTFGGKSSPWLFNLYSEMVHWVVSSCLPSSLPLSHYLDDFFGMVPAGKDTSHPVRMLAIACKALGLNLSPSKTLFGTTKLEILGIEVNTEALTLGITDQRRSSILCTIEALLQPGRLSLLQLQHISGLLQFVMQVAPLGCVHLGRLYAALRRAHHSPLSLLRLPKPATAELRLTTLSSWHVDLGLDSSAFSHPRTQRALKGFKRLYGITQRGQKLRITLPVLHSLLDTLRAAPDLSPSDRVTFAAAFTLTYACLLRCTEFTWSSLDDSVLQVGSITWSKTCATLRLARSKSTSLSPGLVALPAPTLPSPGYDGPACIGLCWPLLPLGGVPPGLPTSALQLKLSKPWGGGPPTASASTSIVHPPPVVTLLPPTSSPPPPLDPSSAWCVAPQPLAPVSSSKTRPCCATGLPLARLAVREPHEPVSTLMLIPQS